MNLCCARHPARGTPYACRWLDDWQRKYEDDVNLEDEVTRYRQDFLHLYQDPLDSWAPIRQGKKGGPRLYSRPLLGDISGRHIDVYLSVEEFECYDGVAFYKYLMTPEGFFVIDPSCHDHEEARLHAHRTFEYQGCQGYHLFNAMRIPAAKPRLVSSISVFDDPNCTLINFTLPAQHGALSEHMKRECHPIPIEMIYSVKVEQISKDRIRVLQLFATDMGNMVKSTWLLKRICVQYYVDVSKRFKKVLFNKQRFETGVEGKNALQ